MAPQAVAAKFIPSASLTISEAEAEAGRVREAVLELEKVLATELMAPLRSG